MTVRAFLQENILLFDGAMGTYYEALTGRPAAGCEGANLSEPGTVLDIHRQYLAAGCRAIKTNTFAANRAAYGGDKEHLRRVIAAGCALAKEAAGEDAFVFADIGPAPAESAAEEYRLLCRLFLEQGITSFLFETLPDEEGVGEAVAWLRQQCPESFVIASFAVQANGYTPSGRAGAQLLREMGGVADAVGFNCICGAYHMYRLAEELGDIPGLLSMMPNAGYPTVVGSRAVYHGDRAYFAGHTAGMASLGVKILGGCCGTTPAHMAAVRARLKEAAPAPVQRTPRPAPSSVRVGRPNRLWEKLEAGRKAIAVELDPPTGYKVDSYMRCAWELKCAGADAITIADCPVARARMDSSILACKLRRDLDIDPIPHLTCRDRNINATKALLLGLTMERVDNVLVVTGDPVPTAERNEVKAVYNFNSRKLARFISELNARELTSPVRIFGALNLNARNFQVQLHLARQKIENGVSAFLTQPVHTQAALENLKEAHACLDAKILGGVMPVVSYRNACFMNSEVAGITVDERIVEALRDKNREEGEALALSVAARIAREMYPYVDGYYLITPFLRTGLMAKLIAAIRALEAE